MQILICGGGSSSRIEDKTFEDCVFYIRMDLGCQERMCIDVSEPRKRTHVVIVGSTQLDHKESIIWSKTGLHDYDRFNQKDFMHQIYLDNYLQHSKSKKPSHTQTFG